MAMNIIGNTRIRFEATASGRLAAIMNDERYENIQCVPLFPLFEPGTYISVQHKKEKEYDEVCIIKSLDELPADQRTLVEDNITFRYFMPEITHIKSIKGEHGKDLWVVKTNKGEKEFTVQDRKENVHINDRGTVFVTDADGCRYKISDYRTLPEKAKTELERVLL
jgi:hypothetical protein